MVNCPRCNKEFIPTIKHNYTTKYCSRSCANTQGKRTNEFKEKVRKKLIGRSVPKEQVYKSIVSRGFIPKALVPNTVCIICSSDTGSKTRKTCSDSCFKLLKKLNSQQNKNCGGQKHTHRSIITNIKNENFVVESSYEVKLAADLNENNIYWVRPEPFIYTDKNNHQRRYYPDFYLPEYSVYLDPKNDFLIKTDLDKIFRVQKANNLKIIVLGKDYLTWDKFKNLVVDDSNALPSPACKTGVLLLN